MAFSVDNRNAFVPGGKGLVMPLLPLRDIIVFPHLMVPLFVGREKSVAALNMAMTREREIFLVAQRNAKTNDPKPEDDLEKRAPTTEAEAIDAARSGLSRVMRGNS